MAEGIPITGMGSPIIPTKADTKDPIKETGEALTTPVVQVVQTKSAEETLNDTINGYVDTAMKWFGLSNTEENVAVIHKHLAKLINSLKEI